MTHRIIHQKVSTVPDAPDATLVKPSDWNSDHAINWGFATPNQNTITAADADVTGDPFFDKVSLLLHFDGVDYASSTTDSSGYTNAITFNGAAKLRASTDGIVPVFGTTKLSLDGDGSYLSIPHREEFAVTTDFTVEAWVYPREYKDELIISKQDACCEVEWALSLNLTGELVWKSCTNDSVNWNIVGTGVPLPLNQWSHVAGVQSGGIYVFLYLNGVEVATTMFPGTPATFASANLMIGRDASDTNRDFYGCIDDVRISHGVARYNGAFTPPTIPFYNSFPGVNFVAGRNYQSAGPITIEETDVNIPNGTNWVII